MTTPYFHSEKRQQQLRDACLALEGTRFVERQMDCVAFVCAVYGACGLPVKQLQKAPRVSLNYGRFHEDSALLAYLLENQQLRKRLKCIEDDEPLMTGDLVGIRQSLSVNHLGVIDGDCLWHVPRRSHVHSVPLVHIERLIAARFRIMS